MKIDRNPLVLCSCPGGPAKVPKSSSEMAGVRLLGNTASNAELLIYIRLKSIF